MHKEVAIDAAKKAGEVLMKYYGNVETKIKSAHYDAGSLVTEADLEAEKIIISILEKNFPDYGIFSEEAGIVAKSKEFVWYVDPLDGTSNFIRGIPLFGISIGLIQTGKSICGVLYFPALDLLVSAESGKGAYANDKKINVSNRPLEQALYWSGGKFGGKFKGEIQLSASLTEKVGLVKIIDASSYEFASIATGNSEIYYLPNIPHDVVAGVCIVEEAGGKVTDEKGNSWALDSKMILATNRVVHDEALKAIG